MQVVLGYAALIAIDPVELFRVPCMLVDGLPYFKKLQLLIGLPILLSICLSVCTFIGHVVQARVKHRKRIQSNRRMKAAAAMERMKAQQPVARTASETHLSADQLAQIYKEAMQESLKHGVHRSVSLVCLLMDELYPSVTRTIFQIFRCRELGASGWWLEADYNNHCFDEQWSGYLVLAIPAMVIYAIGIPLGFFLVVRRYKKKGMLDDPDIDRMIGWLHKPFRPGCEYWLAIELLRKLVLTACVGFLARSCHYKLVLAQLIAFG